MNQLELAISIASKAFAGYVDKGGNPYILHCLRVMLALRTEEEMIVGVLHDLLEDTDSTIADLIDYGFSESVVNACQLLTRDGLEYMDYIKRVKANALATRVKMKDIEDNLDESRIPGGLSWSHRSRYLLALAELCG